MKTISQTVFNALNTWRLKPDEWSKKWYKYNLVIQELVWSRNVSDGYIIDVLDWENNFLERVKVEIRPVIEFGCVHNKMFLKF